ncbi:MAG: hypothetical protein EA352_02925 [Gemmatimonadales bacterium]|nr:MAG: hypothetical protein EA352_02925 [Gemmatimonadales bacterium]
MNPAPRSPESTPPAPTGPFRWHRSTVDVVLGPSEPATGTGVPRGFTGISTDTRTLRDGELWIALSGPRFDGNEYARRAVELGAGGLVLRRDPESPNGMPPVLRDASVSVPVWLVDDPLASLGRLARARRDALGVPVVAITGSTGKTTTKGYLRAALEAWGPIHATRANENNRVGVPHTLLATPTGVHAVVLELGTSEPGEIRALTRMVDPDLAVLTTVDPTHLEGLGSLEGVMEEKLDLIRGLRPGVPVVVGADPAELAGRVRALRPDSPVTVAGMAGMAGSAEPAGTGDATGDPHREGMVHWEGTVTEMDDRGRPTLQVRGPDTESGTEPVHVELPLVGRAASVNAVLALAAARTLGLEPVQTAHRLAGVPVEGMRGRVRTVGGITLVEDCYNANPRSTRAALDLLAELPAPGRRIAVLGSMLELGEASGEHHARVLEHARSLRPAPDLLVLVGEFVGAARGSEPGPEGPRELHAGSAAGAAALLAGELEAGDVLLLKGSRGVRLEEVSRWLEEA